MPGKNFVAGDNNQYATFTEFAELWNRKIINGEQLSSNGFATYQLKVLLPQKRGRLALNIPDFYSSYRLYLNGKIFSSSGVPDSSMKD